MNLTIRTKLTLWYTTLLTISILSFGLLFSYTLSKIIIENVDSRISSVADMMANSVFKPPLTLNLPEHFDLILERFFGIKTAGNYIQVLNSMGNIKVTSSTLEGTTLPLSEAAYRNALKGRQTYELVKTAGPFPIRIVTYPIMSKGRLELILQVGTSMKGTQDIFHALFYILMFGGPVMVILAGIIGWFLAGKALSPVDNITQMARKIGAESLNERLSISGPRDEIGRLAETFNDMISRLEASFRKTKRFTADASHELKTPLTIMKGEIEVALRTENTVEGLKDVLLSTLEEIDRMSHIVRNLLDLARADTGDIQLTFDKVHLDSLLRERFKQSAKRAAEAGLELRLIKTDTVTVNGDRVRLEQLIYNLIDNAIKYTPDGGKIELSLEAEKDWAIISVKDTGVGISKDDLPYLFDRFYRVDKARTRDAGGVGLGLSICKEIVTVHGGRIDIESEPDNGSNFIVYLPRLME